MNQNERKIVARLLGLQLPPAIVGATTRTTSTESVVGYSVDAPQWIEAIKKVLYSMAMEACPGTVAWEDYTPPVIILDAMEEWIRVREAENWKTYNSTRFQTILNEVETRAQFEQS